MKLAALATAFGTLALAALTAAGAQAQTKIPSSAGTGPATASPGSVQPVGSVGTVGTSSGSCGTSVGGGGMRRLRVPPLAVVGSLQQLAALDAAIVGTLDGIVLAGTVSGPGTPGQTLAGLVAQRTRLARQLQEQALDPIYATSVPVDAWTLELLVALQRLETMARAGLLGRTEYVVLRKHLIQTLESQQQTLAASAGIVVQGAGPQRRLRPQPIGIAP